MTTQLEQAARLALESLNELVADPECDFGPSYALQQDRQKKAIIALHRALANSALDRMYENERELGVQMQLAQEPVAWRDHVEQRLLTWRQSFVNKSGDQLALNDFMDKRSLDDLIDYVCDEYSNPKQLAQDEPVALETVYETIIQWDEGGGKRSRRELARRIVALYTRPQAREPLAEAFVVKHYASDERPSIKGNGFDGLEVGENREEAEAFVTWINERIAAHGIGEKK